MSINLRIPEDLDAKLAARAARSGRSKSALLLQFLATQVEDDIQADEHERAVRNAAEASILRWKPVLDELATQ